MTVIDNLECGGNYDRKLVFNCFGIISLWMTGLSLFKASPERCVESKQVSVNHSWNVLQ